MKRFEYKQILLHTFFKNVTGLEPEDYREAMEGYSKAIDDYDCFQIYLDSLVLKISQGAEGITGELNIQYRSTHVRSRISCFWLYS